MNASPRPAAPEQMRLALQRRTAMDWDSFVVSPGNAEAVALLRDGGPWPSRRLALVGPEGSGKSHLARAWATQTGARVHAADAAITAFEGPAVVEDVDRRPPDDEALFHLINAADTGSPLVLTARSPPRLWPSTLPDLRSRLNALRVIELSPPDDAALASLLERFFRERNIRVEADVVGYLTSRIERSVPTAAEVVARIDEAAHAKRREITRVLAREVLDEGRLGPDLFDEPCEPGAGASQEAPQARRNSLHDR